MPQKILTTMFFAATLLTIIKMQFERYIVTRDKGYIFLDPIIQNNHTCTFIFLHGLGGSAEEYIDIFKSNVIPKNCRIVLPNGKTRKIDAENGEKLPAWYNIYYNSHADP